MNVFDRADWLDREDEIGQDRADRDELLGLNIRREREVDWAGEEPDPFDRELKDDDRS